MVAAIAEDQAQNVWVSVDVGPRPASCSESATCASKKNSVPTVSPLVRRLAPDPTGGIWLGFEDGNLGHYQGGKLEIFPLRKGAETGYLGFDYRC
jgi:hypothetical protein